MRKNPTNWMVKLKIQNYKEKFLKNMNNSRKSEMHSMKFVCDAMRSATFPMHTIFLRYLNLCSIEIPRWKTVYRICMTIINKNTNY